MNWVPYLTKKCYCGFECQISFLDMEGSKTICSAEEAKLLFDHIYLYFGGVCLLREHVN